MPNCDEEGGVRPPVALLDVEVGPESPGKEPKLYGLDPLPVADKPDNEVPEADDAKGLEREIPEEIEELGKVRFVPPVASDFPANGESSPDSEEAVGGAATTAEPPEG